MSTELHDALAQAADAGRARFDTRDAAEVISPATRRVSRHRTAVRVGTGMASVVAIAGLVWAVDGVGPDTDVDPAVPSGVTSAVVDAESLLASATPRTRLETDSGVHGGTPALICDAGDRNPHLDDVMAFAGVTCDAVWVDPGVVVTMAADSYVTVNVSEGTITYEWSLANTGDDPLRVDVAGIIPVLVSEGDGAVSPPATANATLAVADEWDTETTKSSVLTSAESVRILAPGDIVRGTATWDVDHGGFDAVQRVLDTESAPWFALHVRIAPSGEPGSTEFLLDVLDDTTSPVHASTTSVWDVADLAAIAEPREEGEERSDATAGMICNHETPEHDPRLNEAAIQDPVVSHATVLEDCDAVWFVGGPRTTGRDFVATAAADGSVTLGTTIRSVAYRSLRIDEESVFAAVETAAAPEIPHSWSRTTLTRSLWEDDGTMIAQLDSGATPQRLESEDFYTIAITEEGQTDALVDAMNSGERYTVTYWARVHEDAPDGSATYLIELGTPDRH
jgi:hypothetical protein